MVEWKKIEEFAKCQAGATPSTKVRSYWDGGSIPWMNSGDVHQGVVTHTSGYITQLGYENSSTKMLPKDTVVIALAGQGKTRGTVAITDIELCTNQSICGIIIDNPSIRNKYIYYYLKTRYSDLRRVSSGDGTRGGLNLKMIGAYHIPIPSLSEQNRIVGILDTFTASIENLKEQITQRRKQFEHYRDQLLDLEGKEGVEMKTLGEVCEMERGVRVVKKDLQEEGVIPVYQNSLTPLGYYEKSNYPKNTTFVICAGAAGEVGYSKVDFWAADDCTCIVCPISISSRYVYYHLMVKQHLLKAQVRKASVPRLSKDVIAKQQVFIPSLQDQQRIVSILDTFEASIQNLEAQLAQREKQYEYYRNKLLTFE